MAQQWYVYKDGQQLGPFTREEFDEQVKSGAVNATDLVWTAGFDGWFPAQEVDGLFAPPSPPPSGVASPPPPPPSRSTSPPLPPSMPPPPGPEAPSDTSGGSPSDKGPPIKSRKLIVVAGVAILVVGIIGAGWWGISSMFGDSTNGNDIDKVEPLEEQKEDTAPEPVEELEESQEPPELAEGQQTISDIVGIVPEARIMAATEVALEAYGLQFGLIEGNDATMTAELGEAIENDGWMVVTGWTPHWKFAKWDLKFLEDPEQVFGEEEYIATVAREGFSRDMPEVYAFLEEFYWDDDEIGKVIINNLEDDDFLGNAQTWIEENRNLVEEWVPKNLGDGASGQEIKIQTMKWDCAIATSYVIKAILQDAGFEVDLISTSDGGEMWYYTAVGEVDFFACAWLPYTHVAYYEEYGNEVDEIRANYEGARMGLVVPEYVDIESIPEIKDYMLD